MTQNVISKQMYEKRELLMIPLISLTMKKFLCIYPKFIGMDIFAFYDKIRVYNLTKHGLTIGNNVFIGRTANIDYSNCNLISIGNNCVISNGAVILAHDASANRHLGCITSKKGKVIIGDGTFIGVNAVILPNVTIGKNVVVGAGSVVTRSVPDNVIVAGNPAKIIESLEEFIDKRRKVE